MPSVAINHFTSFLLWSFLPPLASRILLSLSYSTFPSLRPSLPISPTQPDITSYNSKHVFHQRTARSLLVASYLLYTLYAIYSLQSHPSNLNHFDLLGLPRSVLDNAGPDAPQVIKSHWRKLARVYHPDKVGKEGEEFFVRLRNAVETVEDDGKRWAYERFGPQVDAWKGDALRVYLVQGATQALTFYVVAGGSIGLLSMFRADERGNGFWRLLLFLLTLSLESLLLVQPSPSPLFATLFPHRATYQHIEVLRQAFISASMALSQLLPLFSPPASETPELVSPEDRARQDAELLWPMIERLGQLRDVAESELSLMVGLEVRSLMDDEDRRGESGKEERMRERLEGMKERMMESFLDLKVKSSKEGAEAWNRAVEVGREREKRGSGIRRRPSLSGVGGAGAMASREGGLPSPPPE